jgi:hypothetical protein
MTGREKTNPETPTTYEEYRALEFKESGYGEGDDDNDFEDYFNVIFNYLMEDEDEDDGQPDELKEWEDFDPEC